MSKICKKCGGTVKMEDTFCMHCGQPLEKEPAPEVRMEENKMDENKAEVLSVWDYLLMLILMAIPVVNIVVCILWIVGKNGNPNRRNFAKAWLIMAVIGTILSVILTFGMIEFFVLDNYVSPDYQFQHTFPETEFLDDFPVVLDEI